MPSTMAEPSRAELKYLVERQREEVKTLNEVGRLLSSTTSSNELIRLVAGYLHRTYPVALCGTWFAPQKTLHLVPFAAIPQVELAGATRQVRQSAATILNHTITEEDSRCVIDEPPAGAWMQPSASLRAHLFSPITANGEPIGLLSIFSGQAEAFGQEDRHAVGIIAEQLGAALRNALLVDELRHAVEVKNELLSVVSHELSTPLTAIKEGVNLVLEGTLGAITPDQQDFLKTVVENTDRLERLIQKVKIATELMTGQTKFAKESFDLRQLLVNAEKAYRAMAKAKGVLLKLVEHPKPVFWQVDVGHTAVALNQVIENAIQATPAEGVVTLKLSATPTEAEIQVLDTGAGIPKEVIPTLFEQFKSVGGIHDRKMGGLGLGLSIAKALVTGQGGTISVDSTVDQGTLMTIHLPKAAAPPPA